MRHEPLNRSELARSLREGSFTSLGCYPKFYLTAGGEVLSHEAVMSEARRYLRAASGRFDDASEARTHVLFVDVNWEDPELYCAETGERIPSAYAEPEENNVGC